ncbi:homoserine kinase, partial [Micromonospora sp. NPDC000207]|uniref:homoserine kinase n=1 Tax=Micromonospora sp. NPDC000207 TaxID=3154246 RepID=UPI00331CD09C
MRVRVPATSANLGPGFDALGLALGRYDDVAAEVTTGGVRVTVHGEGADELPADDRHLVVRAMRATFEVLGGQPPGLAVECVNRIPQARGLGSSSAAIVAGVQLARALVVDGTRRLDDAATLRLAAEIEGHPDNVAPCLLGGFTVAWTEETGARAVSLPVTDGVRPTVFVPVGRGLTAEARAALPQTVPHA